MAKKRTTKKKTSKTKKKISFKLSSQQKLIFGSLLLIFGIYLFIAFVSYLFTGEHDQSVLNDLPNKETEVKNWTKWFGAELSEFFIYDGFGVAAFMFSGLIFLSGIYILSLIHIRRCRRTP